MINIFGIILAIFIGICISLQPVFTSNMGRYTGIFESAFISILTTFTLITIIFFIFGKGDITQVSEAPKYYLLAGFFGITAVVGSIFTVRILGPAAAISIAVASQIIVSVFIEHYGAFGLEKTPLSITRVAGMILMIAGVVLIRGIK